MRDILRNVIRTRCPAVFHKLPGERFLGPAGSRNLMQSLVTRVQTPESGSQLALFHGVKRGFREGGKENA